VAYVEMALEGLFWPTWSPGIGESKVIAVVARVETEDGIEGWGAGDCSGPTAAALIRERCRPLVVGRDLRDIEGLYVELERASHEYRWLWCVELACWDALGIARDDSVAGLLGTDRRELKAYASFGERRDAATRKEDVARAMEAGFTAVKLRFRHDSVKADLEVVEEVRGMFGDSVDLMVDANQSLVAPGSSKYQVWDFKTARYVADALAELDVLWLEEPLPEDREGDASRLRDLVNIPISGGELRTGLREYWDLIAGRHYDILQPDVTYGGGISGCRRIAHVAEGAGLAVIPHCWSNGLGLLANLHFACSLRSCNYIEVPYDPPVLPLDTFLFPLVEGSLRVDADGMVRLPDRPGFGAVLREDVVEQVRASGASA